MNISIKNLDDLKGFAENILRKLENTVESKAEGLAGEGEQEVNILSTEKAGDEVSSKKAVIMALSGDLGAGKTTFTQFLASILGVEEAITSPTFVIQKSYQTKHTVSPQALHRVFHRLIHIDAYRLEKSEELLKLGFASLLGDPQNLIVIEWPERVEDILPKNQTIWVHIKHPAAHMDTDTREIEVSGLGDSLL